MYVLWLEIILYIELVTGHLFLSQNGASDKHSTLRSMQVGDATTCHMRVLFRKYYHCVLI